MIPSAYLQVNAEMRNLSNTLFISIINHIIELLMERKITVFIIFLLIFTVTDASSLTLKLASLLPEGTEWDRKLKSMAADWSEISNGRVKIRIYSGGIAGTEPDVIRKMRFGQIDMAVLTAAGMTAINPDSFAISIPFLLETEEELDFVLENIAPDFEEGFREEGFIVLSWAKSGWINIFSKNSGLCTR